MSENINVTLNDDYGSLSVGDYSFYYGYEVSWCEECKKQLDAGHEYCEDHNTFWCFEVSHQGSSIMTIPSNKLKSDMFNVPQSLLEGVGLFIKSLSQVATFYATKEITKSVDEEAD